MESIIREAFLKTGNSRLGNALVAAVLTSQAEVKLKEADIYHEYKLRATKNGGFVPAHTESVIERNQRMKEYRARKTQELHLGITLVKEHGDIGLSYGEKMTNKDFNILSDEFGVTDINDPKQKEKVKKMYTYARILGKTGV